MSRPVPDELTLQRRSRGVDGLSLFDAQRVAAPDVAHEVRRAPTVHLEGSGQKARKAARPGASTSAAKRHMLALLLEAHAGPMTRKEMAAATGWLRDTVNARVSEARNLPAGHEDKMVTDGRREGESLVHLSRKHSLTFSEG